MTCRTIALLDLGCDSKGGDFVCADLAGGIYVVKMAENEIEIMKLAASLQVGHAWTHYKCIRRCRVPTFHQLQRHFITGRKAGLNQAFRDPGTTHLVLFAKFSARSCANECDRIVGFHEAFNRRAVVPK